MASKVSSDHMPSPAFIPASIREGQNRKRARSPVDPCEIIKPLAASAPASLQNRVSSPQALLPALDDAMLWNEKREELNRTCPYKIGETLDENTYNSLKNQEDISPLKAGDFAVVKRTGGYQFVLITGLYLSNYFFLAKDTQTLQKHHSFFSKVKFPSPPKEPPFSDHVLASDLNNTAGDFARSFKAFNEDTHLLKLDGNDYRLVECLTGDFSLQNIALFDPNSDLIVGINLGNCSELFNQFKIIYGELSDIVFRLQMPLTAEQILANVMRFISTDIFTKNTYNDVNKVNVASGVSESLLLRDGSEKAFKFVNMESYVKAKAGMSKQAALVACHLIHKLTKPIGKHKALLDGSVQLHRFNVVTADGAEGYYCAVFIPQKTEKEIPQRWFIDPIKQKLINFSLDSGLRELEEYHPHLGERLSKCTQLMAQINGQPDLSYQAVEVNPWQELSQS